MLAFSCENKNARGSVFLGNVLGLSLCKHSKTTIWMKMQNGGLVTFAHSSYCLTIHQLIGLFIDRIILEDQDIFIWKESRLVVTTILLTASGNGDKASESK